MGDRRFPMNGPATTIATSVVDPPMRRTTTGMKATRTVTKAPAHIPLKRSMRKLRRTRAGSQFGSVTARKLTACRVLCHQLRALRAAFGTRSIAAGAWPVTAARSVAASAWTARRPGAKTATARWPVAEWPAGAGRSRTDNDASVRLHADRLRLQPGLPLHREVNDSPRVSEHRLERHGLAARANTRRDALRDLAELVLAPAPIALDVNRNVNGPAHLLRGDGADDLLQRDEVLAAATDERTEVGAEDIDSFHAGTILERDFGVDAHRVEQFAQHGRAQRELLGERGRGFLALLFARAHTGVGTARDLGLVDDRLGLGGALVLLEREHHARILAAHAQHIRGLALLEDLDVDLGAFAAERPQSALDRL